MTSEPQMTKTKREETKRYPVTVELTIEELIVLADICYFDEKAPLSSDRQHPAEDVEHVLELVRRKANGVLGQVRARGRR